MIRIAGYERRTGKCLYTMRLRESIQGVRHRRTFVRSNVAKEEALRQLIRHGKPADRVTVKGIPTRTGRTFNAELSTSKPLNLRDERSIALNVYSNLIDLISTVTPGSEVGSKRKAVTQPPQFGFCPTSKV